MSLPIDMSDRCGRRYTRAQREAVKSWVAAGLDYPEIRALLRERGWPVPTRQLVDYYRKRLRKGLSRAPSCPTCGRALPARPAATSTLSG